MSSSSFTIDTIKVSSSDWANFCSSAGRVQDSYKWPDDINIWTMTKMINDHPAARLISINNTFSYFRRKNQEVYPEQDLAISCVNAMVDLHKYLDDLLNYIPSDLS